MEARSRNWDKKHRKDDDSERKVEESSNYEVSLPLGMSCRCCRGWDHASCALPPPISTLTTRSTSANLFAYTFCKITLCGLHPRTQQPRRSCCSSFSTMRRARARLTSPQRELAPFARRQTTLQVSPRGFLMYAELYGEKFSKFGIAVLGTFTMSISQPGSCSFYRRQQRGPTTDKIRS